MSIDLTLTELIFSIVGALGGFCLRLACRRQDLNQPSTRSVLMLPAEANLPAGKNECVEVCSRHVRPFLRLRPCDRMMPPFSVSCIRQCSAIWPLTSAQPSNRPMLLCPSLPTSIPRCNFLSEIRHEPRAWNSQRACPSIRVGLAANSRSYISYVLFFLTIPGVLPQRYFPRFPATRDCRP